MILAKLNQPEFEYDIHSLIKAFFPEENVSATAEDKKYEEEITLQFQVEYEPQQIKIEWKENGQESHDRSFPVCLRPMIFRGRKNGGRDQNLHAKNVLCIR